MVSSVELPLSKLAQQLAQKQTELEAARRAYEKRLAELTRQKEQLQAQLRTVESEIKAVSSTVPSGGSPASPRKATPVIPAPRADGPTLPGLLVKLVRAAEGPITVKKLTEGVKRARFRSTSGNLPRMVKNKVGVLVKRGVLRRAEGQPGVVLGQIKVSKRVPRASKPVSGSKAAARNGKAVPASARSADAQARGALRTLLVQSLGGSDRPMTARELADKVLQGGYKTESKQFVNVVWDALGKIKEVENVRGQGYRLKKRPAKAK
jgi:hypothetical protein